jgi:hypothetical protein
MRSGPHLAAPLSHLPKTFALTHVTIHRKGDRVSKNQLFGLNEQATTNILEYFKHAPGSDF